MRQLLAALRTPVDPVVAVRDTECAANSAVQLLGNAGYHAAMLTVIGRKCPFRPSPASDRTRQSASWLQSGTFWGLCVAALVSSAALALPASVLGPSTLLLVAVLALALQAGVVATAAAAKESAGASWNSPSANWPGYEEALDADKLLLVVDGTRSEIALARALLKDN